MENFSYNQLFNKLSVNNIIRLLEGILYEKQIVLFAENTSDIVLVCETILSLIQPLKWICIYVPILPNILSDTLNAINPYIIGMNTKDYLKVRFKHKIPRKKIIFFFFRKCVKIFKI